jgi:predicted DsbA family dithiol-disulfide isomerase
VRLHQVLPEYRDRVRLCIRAVPLEVAGGEAAPRDILEQEWWLAALQELQAKFAPYQGDDWPTTTLPAFDAVWCAAQQGEEMAHEYDLRVRRAFFGESRNIGRREVLLAVAAEAGQEMTGFTQMFDSGVARAAVLEECRLGREQYGVRGTPTLMLENGSKLRSPIAFPVMQQRRIMRVQKLPCCGESCIAATRELFEQALHQPGS